MNPTTSDVRVQMHGVGSDHSRRPLHLLGDTKESRENYMDKAVPLYNLALKGDWNEEAERMLMEDNKKMSRTALTRWRATALHVAAGANRVPFVQKLVHLMEVKDLELQDENKNTAFFLAAGVGNRRLAEIMMHKNPELPTIRGQMEFTPLHFAVMRGRTEMTKFLYPKTIHIFERKDWENLFLDGINAGMCIDLALGMLKDKPWLATARNGNMDTGLHLLARKELRKFFLKEADQVLQLVHQLWRIILTTTNSESEIREIINNPSPLLFDAVLCGNFEFLAELISFYPDLIWEKDSNSRSIMHFAIEQRQVKILNLIGEMGSFKDLMASSVDHDNNTILHLAAKLAPTDQLDLVSGAAFHQLLLEIIWFKEVEKIMLPIDKVIMNSENLTPSELFTKEHKILLEQAEKWMKGTAESCMLVSTVITAGVFSATFNIPGGNNNEGIPNYLKKPAFRTFSISDAVALISSAASILVFLSILTSRYAMNDFYTSLPRKLTFGVIALFISLTSMMQVAFSSALFITYDTDTKLVPILSCVLAFVIIPLFGYLQFPLFFEILRFLL